MIEVLAADHAPLSRLVRGLVMFPQVLLNVPVNAKPDFQTFPEIAKAIAKVRRQLGERGRIDVRYSGPSVGQGHGRRPEPASHSGRGPDDRRRHRQEPGRIELGKKETAMRLSVNVDHFATLREARRAREPEPALVALLAELAERRASPRISAATAATSRSAISASSRRSSRPN